MIVISYKLTLKSLFSEWIPDSIEIQESERDVYVELIRERYKALGLSVADVRLQFRESAPVPVAPEPEVKVDELEQYHKPKMR